MASGKRPNLVLLGIDTLRADHMSLYGYDRLTTPHLDEFASRGAVFNNCFSPHIPTTPGYTSMFTGLDVFGMDVVALRHQGGLPTHYKTLAEILGEAGYNTSCVGFSGNPASRGFQKYLDFSGWGSFTSGRSPKGENLNAVTLPELERLAAEEEPFFLFLRHMDPHAPYLPPAPFERLFYQGDEFDPANHSLDPVMTFKPFCDFFASWFPPHCKDKDYVIAQYDGALAYMDATIGSLFTKLAALGLEEDTLVVITSDHGENLYDHECWFDHHGAYDTTMHVPLAFVWPGQIPDSLYFDQTVQLKDITPTILDLFGIASGQTQDGHSLVPLFEGEARQAEPEFYFTEATWMRKHGWRTPEWLLIRALEPDFHFKPPVELYHLPTDPEQLVNIADQQPDVVAFLTARMEAHIARREQETGRTNPVFTNLNWNGHGGPFATSEDAYNTMHIGDPDTASKLQAQELQTQRGAKEL